MAAIFRAYHQAYAGLPRAVWFLALLLFVNRCGSMVLPFLTIYLSKVKGYESHHAVQALALYGLGGILGAFLGGALTQRLGAMRVVVASLVLTAPGYLGIPRCDSAWQLALAILYLSTVAEMVRPAIATATSEYSTPETLARSFALNRLTMNLGMAIGPAVGGLLAAQDRWELMFAVNAAAVVATAVSAAMLFGLRGPAAHQVSKSQQASAASPWQDRPFLAFLVLQAMSGLVFFQLLSTLPLYLTEQYHLPADRIGLLFVVNTLMIVAFEMVLTDRLRHFSPLRVVAVGTGLICLGFGMAAFGQSFAFAVALTVVWTIGEMLAAPFSITHVAQRAAGRNRGAYMGLNSVSLAAAGVGGPLVGGALYRVDPQLPWYGCLAMALLLPAGFWLLARREAQ